MAGASRRSPREALPEAASARASAARAARRRSRRQVLQPVTQRLEDVLLADPLRAVEVGRRPGHPPRAMKAASRQSLLLGPPLEGSPRRRFELCHPAQPRRSQLAVEASLTLQL